MFVEQIINLIITIFKYFFKYLKMYIEEEQFSLFRIIYLICNFTNTFLQTFLYFMAGQMLVTQVSKNFFFFFHIVTLFVYLLKIFL